MAAPQYVKGTLFNVVSKAYAVGASQRIGALLDNRSLAGATFFPTVAGVLPIEYQVKVKMTGGASVAATSGLTASAFRIPGLNPATGGTGTSHTTIASRTNATTYVLTTGGAGANDITQNAKIIFWSVANQLGEVITIGSGGVTGDTLTISTPLQTYAANDLVFITTQTPVTSIGLAASVNTPSSATLFLPPGLWFIDLLNTDATNGVTVSATCDYLSSLQ